MKTQIGLGVLSVPVVFGSLGIIPGVIILLVIAGITTWSGYIVGITKNRYPHVYGLDDVGQLMFGRIGREVLGLAFALCTWLLGGIILSPWQFANSSTSFHL